jgi:hypothetical protein
MKPNIKEIGNIVRGMQEDQKSAPNYNAAAAQIVQQGIEDKQAAKYGYINQIARPLPKMNVNPKLL